MKTNYSILLVVIMAVLSQNCLSNFSYKTKELPFDEKAKNTMKNTLCIMSGSFILAFNSTFSDIAVGMLESFARLSNGDINLDEMDKEISQLPEDVVMMLEQINMKMDSAFDGLKEQNETIYNKMFKHEIMKKGVEITTKYDLPDGFKPLSENLSSNEVKRYILKLAVTGKQDEYADDPVIKTFQEIMVWFQEMNDVIKEDTEIVEFMESIKQ